MLRCLERRKSRLNARPLQGIPQRAVQRGDLGEDLAPDGWQAVEGALGVGLGARRQGIGHEAGGAERRQQADARLAIGARLQARALGREQGDFLADRRSRARRLFAHHQVGDGRKSRDKQRRRDKRPAHASCIVGLGRTRRHAAFLT